MKKQMNHLAAVLLAVTAPLALAEVLLKDARFDGADDTIDIRVEGSEIVELGKGLAAGEGTDVVEVGGAIVTPGFIDGATTLGLGEVDSFAQAEDGRVSGINLSAGFDVSTAINRRSSMIPVAPNDGVTTAVVVPVPGEHILAGLSATLSTGAARTVDGQLGLHAFLSEYARRHGGTSRAAALYTLIDALREGDRYRRNKRAYEAGRIRPFEYSTADLEAISRVLERAIPLVVHIDRATDIENLLEALREFDVWLILAGAAAGWQVADQLAEASVPVLLNVLDNTPGTFDTLGARLDNAALLAKAGVTVAFVSTEPFSEFRSLSQAGGVAVAYGMPRAEALRALTENPARIWQISGKGVIEEGAVADLVIWNGDPLEVMSSPTRVMIGGKWVDLRTRMDMLRDRYSGDQTAPPGYR